MKANILKRCFMFSVVLVGVLLHHEAFSASKDQKGCPDSDWKDPNTGVTHLCIGGGMVAINGLESTVAPDNNKSCEQWRDGGNQLHPCNNAADFPAVSGQAGE